MDNHQKRLSKTCRQWSIVLSLGQFIHRNSPIWNKSRRWQDFRHIFKTYQKMLQLDNGWASTFLPFLTPGFGVRNRMSAAAGLHRASRVMLHGLLCWEIHGSIHPFQPGFLTPWQKHQKLAGPSTKWWKDQTRTIIKLNQMTFWWIPLDKPLWGGLRSSYLT